MVKHIIQKRTKKDTTLEEFHTLIESKKIKKKEDHSKKYTVDLSQRYKFKRSAQKIKEIDISISHKIEEIKLLPYSFSRDEIGIFLYKLRDFLEDIHFFPFGFFAQLFKFFS